MGWVYLMGGMVIVGALALLFALNVKRGEGTPMHGFFDFERYKTNELTKRQASKHPDHKQGN
ncbi:hypothetical protein [Solidesulfovibrio magneticus]|uniref:hypothetical protein n=1 Tax=Solidesulfovibrio magneticus TaxID=184917 RepID=UPI0005B78B5E|nr:hypothetical protein [Solidesulfovibrio magneticus]